MMTQAAAPAGLEAGQIDARLARYYAHLDWTKVAPVEPTIPALLAYGTAHHGDRDLLVRDDDRITYAQADARSASLAARLLRHGIGRGSRVAMLMPDGVDFLVTWLAVTRIGALAAPLSTLAAPPELAKLLRMGGAPLLIASDRVRNVNLIARIAEALALDGTDKGVASERAPHLRHIWLWHGEAPWAEPVRDRPQMPQPLVAAAEREVCPADPVTIVYTSGSTADPKGVLHSHGNFLRSSRRWAASMPFHAEDRLFADSPMFWVGGLITTLLAMMHVGGTLVGTAERGSRLVDMIEQERCTIVHVWPFLGRQIAADPHLANRDFSAIHSGSVPELLAFPPPPDAAPFGYAMGMTESAGPHSSHILTSDPDHRGAMGLGAPGMEHRIVDPETGRVLAEGERGELHLRGDTLMLGYEGRERHEVFDRDGWFATGDICTIRDGHLFFHGRRSAMIKTSGANVAPAEVEQALLALDGVAEAHVLGLPDVERGEIVGALIVAEQDREIDIPALLGELRHQIASYKVPRKLKVVTAVPTTATNKLDRRAATALLMAS
ncbi:class I adenylate-forming enzyme family protein [Sphingobium sp. Sx8-8]|uniref:class I adenylate-forming enzyme family protein n=1 Tax=Sphingobium sp. Sx8-8 TaxID=2933617 RepID=UPI001F59F6E4|nr:class I adenylate-forming enzyme family protein [Sphingobium sp. Sx8-8]